MLSTMSDFVLTDEQSKAVEIRFKVGRVAVSRVRGRQASLDENGEIVGAPIPQADLAREMGISQDTLSRLESRFSPNVRAGEMGKVMRFYGIVPNDIFTLMGLYSPPEPREGEKEYIRADIIPLLTECTHEQLEQIKRIVQAFVGK